LPTARLSLAPCLSRFPGRGVCESTLPFFLAVEVLCLTDPTPQCDLAIFVLALPTVIPTTFGTTHGASLLANLAVTVRLAVIDTTHVSDDPEQAPDQLRKRELEMGVAVSVTVVPFTKVATHVCPQLIPAGELVTRPFP
jgi:hypothetical protein